MERLAGVAAWDDLQHRISADTGWEKDPYSTKGTGPHTRKEVGNRAQAFYIHTDATHRGTDSNVQGLTPFSDPFL